MNGTLKWIEGMQFVAQIGNHSFVMDTVSGANGFDSAPSPMEFLLMSIAGCTAMDIVYILKKERQKLEKFRVEIKGIRKEEHPRAFTKMELVYVLKGDTLSSKAVQRAIKLSEEKYCSAMEIVRPKAEIVTSYIIEP